MVLKGSSVPLGALLEVKSARGGEGPTPYFLRGPQPLPPTLRVAIYKPKGCWEGLKASWKALGTPP